MLKLILATSALAVSVTAVSAQTAPPIAGQSAPSFVAAASDANTYAIKASEMALSKAQRDDVKAYAKRVLDENRTLQKSLLASLRDNQRTIRTPSSALSSDRASLLSLLQKAPRGSFDNLFLTQAIQVQDRAWSVYKGYAEDGTDPALKQIAIGAAQQEEQELTAGKALLPAALAGDQ